MMVRNNSLKKQEKYCVALFMFLMLFLFIEDVTAQQKVQYPPYQVKSIILRRIPKHFEWPPGSGVSNQNTPFVLSVIGKNPFDKWLDVLFSRKKIKNKPVQVRYINDVKDIPGTNLLFISETSRKELSKILEYVEYKPILTVSDTEGYGDRGVNVNIMETVEKGAAKLLLEVNETTTRRAGLAIKPTMFKDKVEVIQSFNPSLEKAMALENLAMKCKWPSTAMSPPDSPFNIVILGANPFGSNLSRVFKKIKIHDKRIELQYFPNVTDIAVAHIVFISGSKSTQLPRIINNFKNKPVLLVSATDGFAEQGVHVNFFIDVNVKAEINLAALMSSGVSIDRDYINQSRRVSSQ